MLQGSFQQRIKSLCLSSEQCTAFSTPQKHRDSDSHRLNVLFPFIDSTVVANNYKVRTKRHFLSDNLTVFGSEGDGGGDAYSGWVACFSWFDRGWPLIQRRELIGLWTLV